MKILVVDAYYPAFLRWLYGQTPGLAGRPYAEQWRAVMDACFGTADFYSTNLARLGHEATEVVANGRELQLRWAREHGLGLRLKLWRRAAGGIPVPWPATDWIYPVLLAQIRAMRPDVVHVQDPGGTDPAFLREIRPYVRRVTAQIASVYAPGTDFSAYDLIVSSLPQFVEAFRSAGLFSAPLRLGFEPAVLARLRPGPRHDVVFAGGISRVHWRRIAFLEELARRRPVAWWGYGAERLPRGSALRACHRGPAWGIDMLDKLHNARVALNHHDVEGPYANNMRLYEATGVGALLLTDWKENLPDLFEPGREVGAYRSVEECVELIDRYLSREEERAAVARAGQARTLCDHTYEQRMREYVALVEQLV